MTRDPVLPADADPLDDVDGPSDVVATFTSDEVTTIASDATIAEAATAMIASDLGLLVVGTAANVEGVVSERDVVRAVAAGWDLGDARVRDLETTKLVWCDSTARVEDVADMMLEHYVRHVLVEEDGELIGVVSARDLLGAYSVDDD